MKTNRIKIIKMMNTLINKTNNKINKKKKLKHKNIKIQSNSKL